MSSLTRSLMETLPAQHKNAPAGRHLIIKPV
jgi:hypothetical protein